MVWELIVGGMVGVGVFLTLKNYWGSMGRHRKASRKDAGGHPEGAQDKEEATAK